MPIRDSEFTSRTVFLLSPSLLHLVTLYLILLPLQLLAAEPECDPAAARALSVQGALEVRRAGQARWPAAGRDARFCAGDAVRTGKDSRIAILFAPETVIRLDQYSSLVITAPDTETTPGWLELLKGAAHFISRDPRALQITTPLANAAIKGTEFLVQVDERETTVTVYEGRVELSNAEGSVLVGANQRAVAQAGQAPVTVAVVRPRDAVQWTLYYPPVFSPDAPVNTLLQQAQRALAVGRVDAARSELARVLAQTPDNSEALALQSIIALTQNDTATARELAERAVKHRPASAAARIAQSYVQQAEFDLDGALQSLQNAARTTPMMHSPGRGSPSCACRSAIWTRAWRRQNGQTRSIPGWPSPRPCWVMPTSRRSSSRSPGMPSTMPSRSTRPRPSHGWDWVWRRSARANWTPGGRTSKSRWRSIPAIR